MKVLQRIETYISVILAGKLRVSLLSVSVRSCGQTIYILYVFLWDSIKARVQNGIPDSYIHAVLHEESEIWTSLPHGFIKEGLLYIVAATLASRVFVASVYRHRDSAKCM